MSKYSRFYYVVSCSVYIYLLTEHTLHRARPHAAEFPAGPSQPRRRVLLGRLPVQLLHNAAHQGQEDEEADQRGRQEIIQPAGVTVGKKKRAGEV